jgi:hypothetical protein
MNVEMSNPEETRHEGNVSVFFERLQKNPEKIQSSRLCRKANRNLILYYDGATGARRLIGACPVEHGRGWEPM